MPKNSYILMFLNWSMIVPRSKHNKRSGSAVVPMDRVYVLGLDYIDNKTYS